jgi:hypothetical protein
MIHRPSFAHACLAAHLAAADAALALSYKNPAAWALLLLPAAALAGRRPIPALLVGSSIWIARALVAVVAVGGLGVAYPLGCALGLLAGVFLFDPERFSAARALLPASLGVLLAAGFNPVPERFETAVWASALPLVLWLASTFESRPRPGRLVAIVLFASASAAVGRGILLFLPWAQPHVEMAAARYVSPPSASASGPLLGPRLGDVEELALSQSVALRLWSDRPLPLRVGVYTRFIGRFWNRSNESGTQALATSGVAVEAPPEWLERTPGEWHVLPTAGSEPGELARIVLASPMGAGLPAPAAVDAARLTSPEVTIDTDGLVQVPARPPMLYGLRHQPAAASGAASAALLAECLETPASLDPRVRTLAASLGPAAATDAEKIARTVADLATRCRYTLKVGQWRSVDPVGEFLFEKKKGYCEYFATAAAILLRLQGVPARYVNGYSVRQIQRRGDHYLVRASDAHAWVEAYVPGRGWTYVDPTPPGDYEALHPDEDDGSLARLLEALKARWADFTARLRARGLDAALKPLLVPVLIAAVGALAARQLRRRARVRRPHAAERRATVPPELLACLTALESLWTTVGHPRPPYRGLLEHAHALPASASDLRCLSLETVDSFYRSAYGGKSIAPEECARLVVELRNAREAWNKNARLS